MRVTLRFVGTITADTIEDAQKAHAELFDQAAIINDANKTDGINTEIDLTEMSDSERDEAIRKLARDLYQRDGDLEFDEGCLVSEGDDNGAYVEAWKWVDFEGTDFNKSDGEDD